MRDMTFEQFKDIIADGVGKGLIRSSYPLTELDLAIQFAVGREGESGGYPMMLQVEEIAELIIKWCGKETYERIMEDNNGND